MTDSTPATAPDDAEITYPTTAARRRPLLCRLGFHRWYLDCAYFSRADRCDRCGKWQHEYDGEYVERERKAWSAGLIRHENGQVVVDRRFVP